MEDRNGNMSKLYILRLEREKYYVGTTIHPLKRLEAHQNGTASAWTKRYKPVDLILVQETPDPFVEEDMMTIQLMDEYGIENVRGGPYSKVDLTTNEVHAIEQRLRHLNNTCLVCGSSQHYAEECPNQPKKSSACSAPKSRFNYGTRDRQVRQASSHTRKKTGSCFRCGRMGHFLPQCYATTHADGHALYG
jgi:GIY-YIG catalytic domain